MLRDDGYSLIELLVALALLSVVVSMGYSLYMMSVKGYARSIDRIDIQQNVRLAASYIQKKLLNASEDEVTVEKKDDGPDILIIGNEYFDLKGTTLRVNHEWPSSASFNPMAEGITRFEVDKNGKRVTVSISGGEVGKDNFFPVTFEVFLRR
ncbi:prepilin-type N-terminal cleavage/methylation domain-containing protein [Caldicoprobacter algeriensis]|uniref:prepilin-type N-terminal cleavage/methylation domain-containing protein n=1 Tax=Caldicoprobacter algeriensis TaxID=699281 RepID=UPI00207AA199|nr:prepilin-type N-terminal cleavage/methylation domain-containing protein [Caldicoprobacter algeriensis]MCM8900914.1 prepilin-type N-terminal cleavage/methylation domain-containing protein [Caldicoprobacter algeriensis]